MSEIKNLTNNINKWLDDRGWQKNQKPKDLAISISLEAAEVLEHFQWKNDKQFDEHVRESKEEIQDEIADVAIYLFKLADKLNVDLGDAIIKKLEKQSKKYPVSKVRGKDLDNYFKIKKAHRKKN